MAWSLLQSVSTAATASGSTSVSATFTTANLTSGSTVIAAFAAAAATASAPTTPTCTCGGTAMVLIGQVTPNGGAGISSLVALFALNTPAGQVGTKPTVTGGWTNSATASILVEEVSGLVTAATVGAFIDGGAAATKAQNTTGVTPATCNAYSSTAANEYLVAVYGDDGGPATLGACSTGYTVDANDVSANSHADIGIAHKNSTNGAETMSWALTGTQPVWGTILAAFNLTVGTTIALTTPNVALAAPTPAIATTLALTTPNLALAAPSASPFPFDVLPVTTFPATSLDTRVELLINGVWTDVTAYCDDGNPVSIARGHADESTTTGPSTVTLGLYNGDGRFTAGNPLSPYYPNLLRNTRMRVSLPEGASYVRLEGDQASYAQGPTTTNPAGDMEIQLDVTLDNWNGAQTLAAKWNQTGNQRSWLLEMADTGIMTFWASSNGTAQTALAATVPLAAPPLLRQCIRVTYQASTGTATFYTAPPGLSGAAWTQLGAPVIAGALTPFSNTAPVLLGARSDGAGLPGFNGKFHAFQLLQGIAGSPLAQPDFTTQSAGTTSFTDLQSNTWTVAGTAEVSNRKYRIHAEVSAWPQQQPPSGSAVYVPVTAAGPLRRMTAGAVAVLSPMTRAYLRGVTPVLAYWRCEESSTATQFAPSIGVAPMGIVGAVQLASFSGFASSASLPVFNSSTWTGAITDPGGTANILRFDFSAQPLAGDAGNGAVVSRLLTNGTVRRFDVIYSGAGAGGVLTCSGYDVNGANLFSSNALLNGAVNGALLRVSAELVQSGGNVTYNVAAVVAGSTVAVASGPQTLTSATIGAATFVIMNAGTIPLVTSAAGHVSYASTADNLAVLAGPLAAFAGETAAARYARLCSEEGIQCRIRGQSSATPAMGVQTIQTIEGLLQECVDADLGMQTELRQQFGLGYRTRNSISGAAAAVTLAYPSSRVDSWTADPTIDDQIIVNDVTVSQSSGGSSARVVADTGQPITGGTMGVTQVGRYAQGYTVNVGGASLNDNAGWRVHMGTVDEPRFPGIGLDLNDRDLQTAGLILPLLDLDLGDRLTITSPPVWLPPGPSGAIDQVMNGVSESLMPRATLQQSWQGVPYSPWPVLTADDPSYSVVDTDGSTLHASATYGDPTILADTPAANPLWTTAAADFPLLLSCQGMTIQVSACAGSSSPQTFTVSQWGVNGVVKNLTAGSAISVAVPNVAGM